MQYRKDRQGRELSVLGFGCMRFPRRGGGIDMEKTGEAVREAIRLGINYFDTAYIYPGSEAALGEILEKDHLRDQVYIATKLPGYLIQRAEKMETYFQEQLRRLRTDHIDYYLMHMLTDVKSWEKLCDMGIADWIREKKASGAIRQIGFSFHGDTDRFLEILQAYDWDFCQIQYNYMDEHTQAGRRGLEAAEARGIPVIIMEPLRGGKLVQLLPAEAREKISACPDPTTPPALAFGWLWDQTGVTCVLSGMNTLSMVQENCAMAARAVPGCMTEAQHATVEAVREILRRKILVGCTGCRYCMPCPQGVDIPGIFQCYNLKKTESLWNARHEFFQTIALRERLSTPDRCVGCHACEKKCPQHLPIVEKLQAAQKTLMPVHYRIAIHVARRWLFHRKA